MTLQECYTALGGDYDEVLGRLRSESLVQKFVLKFPADPSYDMLQTALAAQDWAEAFRGAHTIKGVCQNLSFTTLYRSSSLLCVSPASRVISLKSIIISPISVLHPQGISSARNSPVRQRASPHRSVHTTTGSLTASFP